MTHLVMDGKPFNPNHKSPARLVRFGQLEVWLPTRLYDLLGKLVRAKGQYVPTKDLADCEGDSVHELIYRLRAELPVKIQNDPKKGYRVV